MKTKLRAPSAHTQLNTILQHLKTRSITQVEAQGLYSISQVASCVYRLKSRGYPVTTTMKQGVKGAYARYTLTKKR